MTTTDDPHLDPEWQAAHELAGELRRAQAAQALAGTWKVCGCGTPFKADDLGRAFADDCHCSKACHRRARGERRFVKEGLPRTGPLTDDERAYWLQELGHRPDGISAGTRRVLARLLVENLTLRNAVAIHKPVITETQDDRWECCDNCGQDWPCDTAELLGLQ